MKCNICKRDNAIIHIQEYSHQGVRKINLCLECALKRGLNATSEDIENIFANLIKNLFRLPESLSNDKVKNRDNNFVLVCPACKTTITNLSDEIKVGCPTCYTVFEQIIDLIVYKNNNSLNYLGQLPEDLKTMKNQKVKLFHLKQKLKQHIDNENFYQAAVVRDEIKDLKQKIKKRIR